MTSPAPQVDGIGYMFMKVEKAISNHIFEIVFGEAAV